MANKPFTPLKDLFGLNNKPLLSDKEVAALQAAGVSNAVQFIAKIAPECGGDVAKLAEATGIDVGDLSQSYESFKKVSPNVFSFAQRTSQATSTPDALRSSPGR